MITIAEAVQALKDAGKPMSGSRLTLLAENGRIPGAEKIDDGKRKTWRLPEDYKITPAARGQKLGTPAAVAISLVVDLEGGQQKKYACNNLIEVDKHLKAAVSAGGFVRAELFQQGRHEVRVFEPVLNPATGHTELLKDHKTGRYQANLIRVSQETRANRYFGRNKEAVEAVFDRIRALAQINALTGTSVGIRNVNAVVDCFKKGEIASEKWLVHKGILYPGCVLPNSVIKEINKEYEEISEQNRHKKRGEVKIELPRLYPQTFEELMLVNYEFRVDFNQSMRPMLKRLPRSDSFTIPQYKAPVSDDSNDDSNSMR